jgi:hypothetical protein
MSWNIGDIFSAIGPRLGDEPALIHSASSAEGESRIISWKDLDRRAKAGKPDRALRHAGGGLLRRVVRRREEERSGDDDRRNSTGTEKGGRQEAPVGGRWTYLIQCPLRPRRMSVMNARGRPDSALYE